MRLLRFGLFCLAWLLTGCATQLDHTTDQGKAYARAQVALGYMQQHQYDSAKQNIDKALEFAPEYYLPYLLLAHYYQQIGNLTQAEQYYQLAMEKDPTQGDVYNNYGAFLCQQARFSQAFAMFDKALAQKEYYKVAQTLENTALCANLAHDMTRQQQALQKLQKLNPERAAQLRQQL
ncbi:type IV pilus biogenesis/stability protein PilW [Pasteurellaceae bacterium HPA106]|uniref:type IV pilus biogenesis/stability protein PilW n=1 Tax=Spirabiliibacterium pneumoniae TaxID=221400 RepID=UPI001AADBC98|nr:type IV pilus biogenesis/stability protein PilW [Spirabiliibacterium pneumoniae]MBE2896205.1 type IV pilus biogenesis/stability protein PilW [Spirabiliibacterium pneumoniae]